MVFTCTVRAFSVLNVTVGAHNVHSALFLASTWLSSACAAPRGSLPVLGKFSWVEVLSGLVEILAVGTRAGDSTTQSSSSSSLLLSPKTFLSFSKTSWFGCFLTGETAGLFRCRPTIPIPLVLSKVSSLWCARKCEARSACESFSPQPGIVHLATAPGKASFRVFARARWASKRSSILLLFSGGPCPELARLRGRLRPPPLFLTILPLGPDDALGSLETLDGFGGWLISGAASRGACWAAVSTVLVLLGLAKGAIPSVQVGNISWAWLRPPGSWNPSILNISFSSVILLRGKVVLPV